jgi:chromosomal replication initiator protein
MLAMWLARKYTRAALSEIGTYFGRRSHSTVISAQKKVGGWVNEQSQVAFGGKTWSVEEAIRRVEDQLRASG